MNTVWILFISSDSRLDMLCTDLNNPQHSTDHLQGILGERKKNKNLEVLRRKAHFVTSESARQILILLRPGSALSQDDNSPRYLCPKTQTIYSISNTDKLFLADLDSLNVNFINIAGE